MAERTSIPYQPGLDGLRGVAVLCVLVFHGAVGWMTGGFLLVSTFFTLSGFLITALLLIGLERDGRVDLVRFWSRRLRRLMPVAMAGVALALIYGVVAGTPDQLDRVGWDSITTLLYVFNFRAMEISDSYWEIFTRPSPLQHFWSLSLEEQYYLALSLGFVACAAWTGEPRRALARGITALAVASAAWMIALCFDGASPSRLYYGTDTRAAEFLAGAALSLALMRGDAPIPWRGRLQPWATGASACFVAFAAFFARQDAPWLYRGGLALYVVATVVLLNAAIQPGLTRRVLSIAPLLFVGRISYGLYVYHWPIYLVLDAERTGLEGHTLLALRGVASLIVAGLSYRFLEQPIRSGSALPRGRAGVAALASFAVLCGAAGTTLPSPSIGPSTPSTESWAPTRMPPLGPAAPDGPARIAIFGDSLAWNIGRGFRLWRREHRDDVSVWNHARFGCGLARGGDRVGLAEHRHPPARCDDWPIDWAAAISDYRPDIVIVHAGIWDLGDRRQLDWARPLAPGDPRFDAWLLAEYSEAVDVLTRHGAVLVWLTSPCIGPAGDDSFMQPTGALEPDRLRHLNEVLLPSLQAMHPERVRLFDLFGAICDDGAYVRSSEAFPRLRSDHLHIGDRAAAALAGPIARLGLDAAGLSAIAD